MMTQARNLFVGVIRFSIGLVLAYILVRLTLKYTGTDLWRELSNANRGLLLLAVLLFAVLIGITIYRWNLLLRVQGLFLNPWDLIRLTMTGVFFNLALPGAVSGDIVKGAFVTQCTETKKAEAILTILLDRIIGLLGLLTLASIMVLIYLPFLLTIKAEYRPIQIAAFSVGAASLASVFGVVLIEIRERLMQHPWISRLKEMGARKLPPRIVRALKRLVSALDLYRQQYRVVMVAILLSMGVHVCYATAIYAIGASVGEDVLGLSDYFLSTFVSNTLSAIPLTPAGIGTRDASIAMFLSAFNASKEKAGVVPVTMTLVILFWGLVGGGVFMFSRNPKKESHRRR